MYDDRLIVEWEKPDLDESDLAETKKPPFTLEGRRRIAEARSESSSSRSGNVLTAGIALISIGAALALIGWLVGHLD